MDIIIYKYSNFVIKDDDYLITYSSVKLSNYDIIFLRKHYFIQLV